MTISKTRGQAAMEFLMTYGWAILVFILAISALAYLGVLKSGLSSPNVCMISNQFACEEFKVTTTQIDIVIRNGRGVSVSDDEEWITNSPKLVLNGTDEEGHLWGCMVSGQAPVQEGFTKKYTLQAAHCRDIDDQTSGFPVYTKGNKMKANIRLEYKESGAFLDKLAQGTLTTRVE